MNDSNTTPDEPERLDAVALLRAHLAQDEASINALLSMVNPYALFAATVGLLVDDLLAQSWPDGLEGLDAHLARLQRAEGSGDM